MDWSKLRKKTDLQVRKALKYISPATKVIAEGTKIISTLKNPGFVAVTNAVTSGLGTLSDLVAEVDEAPAWALASYCSSGQLGDAFKKAGFPMEVSKDADTKSVWPKYLVRGTDGELHRVRIDGSGQLWFWDDAHALKLYEPINAAIRAYLPQAITVAWESGNSSRASKEDRVAPLILTHLTPPDTKRITHRTLALMGSGHRAILIEGRPGIGKTTMAQAIARDAGLGRVVLLDSMWLTGNWSADALRQLDPAVIIVDDIDKVSVYLSAFERLRNSCKLLICTANNGTYDSVIDAALARPARIDEVFTLTNTDPFQRAPFDRLPDKVWKVISQWPQAYLNELELRLVNTPDDLRLKDLADRVNKRTRSAVGMLEGGADPGNEYDWMDSPIAAPTETE